MEVLKFKVGQTFNKGGYKIHIVSVIDEGLINNTERKYVPWPMIVYRYYGKHKQWWHYEIASAYLLSGEIENYREYLKRKKWKKN